MLFLGLTGATGEPGFTGRRGFTGTTGNVILWWSEHRMQTRQCCNVL